MLVGSQLAEIGTYSTVDRPTHPYTRRAGGCDVQEEIRLLRQRVKEMEQSSKMTDDSRENVKLQQQIAQLQQQLDLVTYTITQKTLGIAIPGS